jgi:hypothetical protein
MGIQRLRCLRLRCSGRYLPNPPLCGTIIGPRNQVLSENAVKAARESEVALVFVGDNRLLSDEGRDREYLHLPEVQHELIKAVVAANPRTVLVVNSSCPVALNWEKENVPAILCSLNAGEEQGNAIADALFGDYNPGGKLCSTCRLAASSSGLSGSWLDSNVSP